MTDQPRPTLYLMCGLPGAGKTTLARQLESERQALRLSPDEWMVPLFGSGAEATAASEARATIEGLLWTLAARALTLGVSVILENGFWSRAERLDYRARAEALGARCQLVFLEVPPDELWARLERRNRDLPPNTLHVERSDLERWLGWFEPPTPDELLT